MSIINESIREFLNGRHYATLATHNEDGSIHLTPVWYLFENERFYISSGAYARKFKNILVRPGISIMVDSRGVQGDEQWVSVSGNAEVIYGEESQELHLRILKRYLTQEALEDELVGAVFTAAAEATISLKPDTSQSWQMKDLDDQFFNGVLNQTPEKWFLKVD